MSFYAGRLCLVTGGTGFVGSHIVDALLQQNARVRIPVHERSPHRDDAAIELIEDIDLSRIEDCRKACEGVDVIFHAAGGVGAAGVGPVQTMAGINLNLSLTTNVFQAAWENNVERVLAFSSSTAYPPREHAVKEDEFWKDEPFPGYFGYGWMRRYIEKLSAFVHRDSPVKIAILRPSAVFGPRDNFDLDTCHVVSALIRRAVEKTTPFEVWGSGDEVRDFLDIRDFAAGCLLAIEKKVDCDPVNIGSGVGITIRELAEHILQAAGHDEAELTFNSDRPTAIPYRRIDTQKADRELGFKPKFSLAEGIETTVRWYRDNQSRL